jgi:hypothetical protein
MHKKSLILTIAIVAFNSCSAMDHHHHGRPTEQGYPAGQGFPAQPNNTAQQFMADKLSGLQKEATELRIAQQELINRPTTTTAKLCLGLAVAGLIGAAVGLPMEKPLVVAAGALIAIGGGVFAKGAADHEATKNHEATISYTRVIDAIENTKL